MSMAVKYSKASPCSQRNSQFRQRPPHTLTDALCREIEKYDQICDLIEAQPVHTPSLSIALQTPTYISVMRHLCASARSRPSEGPGAGRKIGGSPEELTAFSARGRPRG
jgi:hypothetical protein